MSSRGRLTMREVLQLGGEDLARVPPWPLGYELVVSVPYSGR